MIPTFIRAALPRPVRRGHSFADGSDDVLADRPRVGDREPEAGLADERRQRPQRLGDVVPGHAHRLGPDVDADPVQGREHRVGLVVLEDRSGVDPEPDRLAVDEVAAGQPLQVVEQEVLDALDVPRVPAGVVERGAAPAMREHERPDAGFVDVVDVVEVGQDVVEPDPRLVDQSLVVRPARLLPAEVPGESPVAVGRVVAEDVADAGSG